MVLFKSIEDTVLSKDLIIKKKDHYDDIHFDKFRCQVTYDPIVLSVKLT